MIVTNATMYSDNPYQEILYGRITDKFKPVRGTIIEAIDRFAQGEGDILHVHWEEQVLRTATSVVEAKLMANLFQKALEKYASAGGRIVWTIHNALPHEGRNAEEFIALRRVLARLATRILVHNTAAISVLQEQVDVPYERLFLLPHFSYIDWLPGFEATAPLPAPSPDEPMALLLGKIRRYKGIELFLEAMRDPLIEGIEAKIVGEPLPGDDYGDELRAEFSDLKSATFDYRRVEDADLAAMLRAASCVVLPYHRFLTSGIALLALSAGTPIVGPRLPQLIETLPAEQHDFLYTPGDVGALAAAIIRAAGLGDCERRAVTSANRARAYEFRPSQISDLFGRCLEGLPA